MDNVLVVDDDPKELINFQEWFKVLYHFEVAIASDGEKAIDMLKKKDISVFCTGVNIPKIDGLELLAYVTRSHPETPCIVMSEYGVPWFHEKQDRQDVLYYVEKPVHPEALATAIFVGLVLTDEGVAYKGISVRSFLPLIRETHKTCGLEIESRDRGRGQIYFEKGQIVGASCNGLKGEEAVIRMAVWERIKLNFFNLPEEMQGRSSDINLTGILDIYWRGKRPRILPHPPSAPRTFSKTRPARHSAPDIVKKTEETIEDKVKKFLREAGQTLKTIPGYQAAGILGNDWGTIALDLAGDVDFVAISKLVQRMVAATKADEDNKLGRCQGLTLQTPAHTMIFLDTGKDYRVIVVMAPESNWYFAKCRVEGGLLRELKSVFWDRVKGKNGAFQSPRIDV